MGWPALQPPFGNRIAPESYDSAIKSDWEYAVAAFNRNLPQRVPESDYTSQYPV